MSLKNINAGDKIVLEPILEGSSENSESKTYESLIYEVLPGDRLEIMMPMEQNELVILRSDIEYDMYIFCHTGPYHCTVEVLDNYRKNNLNMLLIEVTGTVNQFERREYFRFNCMIDVETRLITGDEMIELENVTRYKKYQSRPLNKGMIVDISGGGIRFMSERKYEADSLIYCAFDLPIGGQNILHQLTGEVLSVKENDNKDSYEHRIKFYNPDERTRERIIRFIFEEYRRKRARE